ncbi:autophagy-related protein 101 [Nilaparvata lugens]|uniref:autophagy-related protein 101 n=1 Tax=Nilaparvata lugens TaxID=108931 RepID=UPI000B98778B|nr:autophagy-related protein 101 [Nilaparvata lugens]XP_039292206.1 autophagy-related protein 101 [Nilaparvata lugens]
MNANQEKIDLQVCGNQLTEAVCSIFHTILLNRSVGKFSFNEDGTKSVGTVGYRDVDCNFVDLTYVACSSDVLDEHIRAPIREFSEQLRSCDATSSKPNGQISLQFYQKRKSRWKSTAAVPWEIWNLDVELIKVNNQFEVERNREEIGQVLSEKLFIVIEALDKHIYIPDNVSSDNLDTIFETSFPDIQPYLFEIMYVTPNSNTFFNNTKQQIFNFLHKSVFL